MDKIPVKVSSLPPVGNIQNFIVLGLDRETNQSAQANMEQLRGNTGATPVISIQVESLPYGSAPTVSKTGTNENPNFKIGLPVAKNGDRPELRIQGEYIQYRYESESTWHNLLDIDTLRLHFSDLTEANIAELQRPATDAASALNRYVQEKEETLNRLQTDTEDAKQSALAAAETAENAAENVQDGEDGKTPQFSIGTVNKTTPGGTPSASITPDGEDPAGNPKLKINLTLPTGDTGPVPDVTIGTVTTGDPGSQAAAQLVEDGVTPEGVQKYKLNLTIPQGLPGDGSGNVFVTVTGLLASKTYLFKPSADGSPVGTFTEYTPPTRVETSSNSEKLEDLQAKDFKRAYQLPQKVDTKINYYLLGYAYDAVSAVKVGNTSLLGELAFDNGSSVAYNRKGSYLVCAGSAYTSNLGVVVGLIRNSAVVDIVTLTYNEKRYLALRLDANNVAYNGIYFYGRYVKNGDNADFQRLVDGVDEVSDVEVISTNVIDASVTKLATARKLWGNDFDGSANITKKITVDDPITDKWTDVFRGKTAGTKIGLIWGRDFSAGNAAEFYYEHDTKLLTFGAYSDANTVKLIRNIASGNWGVGTATPSEKLEVNGKIKAQDYIGKVNGLEIKAPVHDSATLESSNWQLFEGKYRAGITDIPAGSVVIVKTDAKVTLYPTAVFDGTTMYLYADVNPGDVAVEYDIVGHGADASSGVVVAVKPDELTAAQKTMLAFMSASKTVTSIANMVLDAQTIYVNASESEELSITSHAQAGQPANLYISNATAADLTEAIPTTGNYISLIGASVTVPAGGYLELSIAYDANISKYKIAKLEGE
ncbi:hypothetical protein LJC38_00070 [Parabacteroides sp. OttesenSCG-928-K15]|nr:hypothetical protein [Parabacteroides sp. OttesenSCG-928-K15]